MSWYIEEQSPIYLDYNATTPIDATVRTAIAGALDLWPNPGSKSKQAEKAAAAIATAREELADLLNVKPDCVIFTSGGTESNNWIIHSALETYRQAHPDQTAVLPRIVVSSIEHPSILEPLEELRKQGRVDPVLVPIDPDTGMVCLSSLSAALSPHTCLVSCMLANNETGVIQPVDEIADIVRRAADKMGTSIFMHSDVAQAIGKMEVDVQKLKCDAVTIVGHKFYGPRTGALVIRSTLTVQMHPLLFGGNQEGGLRSGTENTPMIVGLGAAARVSREGLAGFAEHMRDTRDYFEQQLKSALPGKHLVNFPSSPRLPNTSSVAFPTYPDSSCELLEKCKSFSASTCATCHIGEVSAVLKASGVAVEVAMKTVRFSFGRETSREEVDRVVSELKAIHFLSKFGSSLTNVINKPPVPGF